MIVSYDSAAAAQAEAGLRATAAHLEQTLQDLSSSVAGVCAGWEGDERLLYQDIQRRWDGAAREVHDILVRITQALDANTQAVETMRRRVRSTLSG
ncbi:WXG100 family type VII secretion target [Mobilicoccus sp.]|uniref:WXG100 family type VII secretion target n=1 Tax=Mobilicoccus sp. TaxID=2034349 RepID=UPI00289BBF9C|nr:WXG100 family type VII secretion target [Mobilicoccus sp.]